MSKRRKNVKSNKVISLDKARKRKDRSRVKQKQQKRTSAINGNGELGSLEGEIERLKKINESMMKINNERFQFLKGEKDKDINSVEDDYASFLMLSSDPVSPESSNSRDLAALLLRYWWSGCLDKWGEEDYWIPFQTKWKTDAELFFIEQAKNQYISSKIIEENQDMPSGEEYKDRLKYLMDDTKVNTIVIPVKYINDLISNFCFNNIDKSDFMTLDQVIDNLDIELRKSFTQHSVMDPTSDLDFPEMGEFFLDECVPYSPKLEAYYRENQPNELPWEENGIAMEIWKPFNQGFAGIVPPEFLDVNGKLSFISYLNEGLDDTAKESDRFVILNQEAAL